MPANGPRQRSGSPRRPGRSHPLSEPWWCALTEHPAQRLLVHRRRADVNMAHAGPQNRNARQGPWPPRRRGSALSGHAPAPRRPADGHVHCEWSWDAPLGSMTRSCVRAVELGLPASRSPSTWTTRGGRSRRTAPTRRTISSPSARTGSRVSGGDRAVPGPVPGPADPERCEDEQAAFGAARRARRYSGRAGSTGCPVRCTGPPTGPPARAASRRRISAAAALNEYLRHTSSAIFAVPPRLAAAGDWYLLA